VHDHISFSAFMGDERVADLPAFTEAVQSEFNPDNSATMVITYFSQKPAETTIGSLMAEALCLTAPHHIPHLDIGYVVSWERNHWVGSTCKDPTLHHEFTRDVVRPPGQTIFEDRGEWVDQFEPKWLELDESESRVSQELIEELRADEISARRLLVEAATDPRGMDNAQISAIEHYLQRDTVLGAVKTWLVNGWNLDNLVQLTKYTRNPFVGTAVGMTMAGDGFLPYAGVVAKLTVRTPENWAVKEALEQQDPERLGMLMSYVNVGKEEYLLP
jgi:hypothetical protein